MRRVDEKVYYTISELVSHFGIPRSLTIRYASRIAENGQATRMNPEKAPGVGSSPWLIDEEAVPFLRSRVGAVGRKRIGFTWEKKQQARTEWAEGCSISRVASILGVSHRTAKRFLGREGVLDKESKKGRDDPPPG